MAQIKPRFIKQDLLIKLSHIDASKYPRMNKEMNEHPGSRVIIFPVKRIINIPPSLSPPAKIIILVKITSSKTRNFHWALLSQVKYIAFKWDSIQFYNLTFRFNLEGSIAVSTLPTNEFWLWEMCQDPGQVLCDMDFHMLIQNICCQRILVKVIVTYSMANFLCKWDANICNVIFNADVAENIKICWEPN